MRSLKAQLTLFVIVGLVALILIAFMFAVRSTLEEDVGREEKLDIIGFDEAEGILKNNFKDCISTLASDAASRMALHAGYLGATPDVTYGETGAEDYLLYEDVEVPIVNEETFLTVPQIRERICNKVYVDLGSCMSLDYLAEAGYGIITQPWNTDFNLARTSCDASFRESSLVVKINHPITLIKEGYALNVSEFYGFSYAAFGPARSLSFNLINLSAMTFKDGYELDLANICSQLPAGFSISTHLDGKLVRIKPDNDYIVFQFALSDYTIKGSCIT